MSSSDGNDPADLSTRRLERWTSSVAPRRTPLAAGADQLAVRRFTLLVIAGPDAGNRVVATGERVTAGGHPSAELRLRDPALGPFHFELVASAKQVVLRDLDPARGTRVDGVAVRVAHLRGGSVISAGDTLVRFDTGGDPVLLPLSSGESFGPLVGASQVMRRVFAQLERAGAGDGPVLLEGEPGTGKRTAAAALSDARGGGAILADVGALPLAEQERLLGDLPARAVATTARDLRPEVNAGRFHPELYRRLSTTHIFFPPLRERGDDVNLLTARFLAAFDAGALGERWRSPEQQVELARRSYPANVRDLARHLARAMVLARHGDEPEAVGSEETLAAARASWDREFDAHMARLLQSASPSRNLR